jgi:hypothetical protein
VLYHLRWVESHGDAARVLFNYGDLELRSRTDDALARLNARLVAGVHNWANDVGAMQQTDLPSTSPPPSGSDPHSSLRGAGWPVSTPPQSTARAAYWQSLPRPRFWRRPIRVIDE